MNTPVIAISAREWRDRMYGNTYQSVRVHVDGLDIGYATMAYGHGDYQARATAREILAAAGMTLPAVGNGSYDWRQAGIRHSLDMVNVARQKDMHGGRTGTARVELWRHWTGTEWIVPE